MALVFTQSEGKFLFKAIACFFSVPNVSSPRTGEVWFKAVAGIYILILTGGPGAATRDEEETTGVP